MSLAERPGDGHLSSLHPYLIVLTPQPLLHPATCCRAAVESAAASRPRASLGLGAAVLVGAAAASYGFAAQPLTAHAEAPWKPEKGKGGDVAVRGAVRVGSGGCCVAAGWRRWLGAGSVLAAAV